MEEILERSGASASFVKLAWMFKEWKQSWNLLEPRSFDVCRNTAVPIIVILGYSEIDTEVLDASIKIIESDDYREVSEDNRNTNSVLAAIQEGARFSYKDEQKFIDLFI